MTVTDPLADRGWKRAAAIGLLVVLAAFVLIRGLVPAFTAVGTDFPNYFTAARIVAEGGPVERLYDDSWFQEQMNREVPGLALRSKFAPFPPPTALLLVPLAGLTPLAALRVAAVVSLLCLFVSMLLLSRIIPLRPLEAAVFVLLSGYAVSNSLAFGQPYIDVSTTCILGYYAWMRGRPLLAGMCFGIFVPIKYYPVFILVYFALRGQWRVVLGGVISVIAVASVSIAVLGWPVHQMFLSSVLGTHLVANLSQQDPFTASFQSFDTLFRRLFVFDATANPHPWRVLPGLQPVAVALVKLTIAAVAVVTLVRRARNDSVSDTTRAVALLGITVLLLAPATASYHFALLWLPVGLLIGLFLRERAPGYAWLTIGLYTLISFFPYGHSGRFEGDGGLTVLAYPRLFIVLALFAVSVRFIWTRTRPAASTAAALTS
jgi:hypothetical protein